jgi:hypothetical protein
MYDLFGPKAEQDKHLKIIMSFISGVIQKKKKDYEENQLKKRKKGGTSL